MDFMNLENVKSIIEKNETRIAAAVKDKYGVTDYNLPVDFVFETEDGVRYHSILIFRNGEMEHIRSYAENEDMTLGVDLNEEDPCVEDWAFAFAGYADDADRFWSFEEDLPSIDLSREGAEHAAWNPMDA